VGTVTVTSANAEKPIEFWFTVEVCRSLTISPAESPERPSQQVGRSRHLHDVLAPDDEPQPEPEVGVRGGAFQGSLAARDPLAPVYARALVIGIQGYTDEAGRYALRNSLADAKAVCQELERIGFTVTLLTDETAEGKCVDVDQIDDAVSAFVDTVDANTLVAFAYMGHGAEDGDGAHFFIPQVRCCASVFPLSTLHCTRPYGRKGIRIALSASDVDWVLQCWN
jgi:hypothetical protein